ncbi:hypothetical protein [Caballeronia sp. LZ019]|uniref:hypothetical protein n=1 Tax=Caballeronia sp. LZ019 TaxID=3038555 RepID=UPI0028637447|nr:hypothetical protein [Caballeronia sp. LZ019]MDR5809116.1 hypothetical protein [Caballeronia sp. LZ019]
MSGRAFPVDCRFANFAAAAWTSSIIQRGISTKIKIGDDLEALMKQGRFITLGRSIVAYLIGMIAGAMMYMPALAAAARHPFSFLLEDRLVRFVEAEVGVALMGLMIFALPIFPFYAAGVLLAKHLGIRHWFYFVSLGVSLSLGLWAVFAFLPHHRIDLSFFQIGVVRGLVAPIGAAGGLACWLFLYLTCARKSI